MTELNENAQALVDRVRGGFEANASDRARVRAAMRTTLLSGGGTAVSATPRFAILGLGGGVLLLGLSIASIAFWGSSSDPSAAHVSRAIVKRSPASARAARVEPAPSLLSAPEGDSITRGSALSTHRTRHRPTAVEVTQEPHATTPIDSLAEEMRIIRQARSAFRRDDFQTANRILDEHSARYASGMLVEEREALRVMCACKSSSDADEVSSLEAQFLHRFPNSSSTPSIRSACDRR